MALCPLKNWDAMNFQTKDYDVIAINLMSVGYFRNL